MIKKNITTLIVLLVFSTQSFTQSKLIFETEENDQKVHDLGLSIDESIYNSSVEDYMSLMAVDQFIKVLKREINNLSVETPPTSEAFFEGIKIGIESMPKKMIQEIESGSSYDFINYRYDSSDKAYYMLFRLYSDTTGINYHDYRVCEVNGELKFKDMYVYTSGEFLSETFGRMYIYTIPEKKRSKLFGKSNYKEFLKFLTALNQFTNGDYEDAYKKMKTIEGDFTKEKYFYLFKSQMASNINDDEYLSVLKEMVEIYPDDTTLYLNYIDYYIMLEDYDSAIKTIDDLIYQTDDDFLIYMKGNVEYSRGNYSSASEHFKYTTENYPDFADGFTSYISTLNFEKQFKTLVDLLEFMVDDGYDKEAIVEYIEELDVNGYNELDPLVQSKEYQNWKKLE